jgi:hypothetical protein
MKGSFLSLPARVLAAAVGLGSMVFAPLDSRAADYGIIEQGPILGLGIHF